MALLRLEARDHADQRRLPRNAELVAHPAGRHGRREPLEIDAVRDDREAGVSASLATHLVLDARRRNDQPIHPRRQRRQQCDVLGRADARGVHGGHDHRRAGGDGRASPDHLGAEHVSVDEVDLVVAQPAGKLSHGQRVVALVQDIHGEAEPPEALDSGAGRERQGAHVVSAAVEAQQETGVALLGAAVAAGRQQLEDPRPGMASGPMDPPMAGVRRAGDGALVVGHARPQRST